jgi:O-antigen ligase
VLAAAVGKPLADRFAAPAPDERDARRLVDVSGHGRTQLWQTAWHEGVDHPVVGGGAGTWARSAIAQTGRVDLPANAHSLELETFAELGLLGGVLLLAAVIG